MLVELAVTNLGVIGSARVDLSAGMTALTGETGAGKTMLVEAMLLLMGGRADADRVRTGAASAEIEGLIVDGDNEMVVRRVVRADAPSRCYVDGRLVTAAELTEIMAAHVEVHGQHSQQQLMSGAAQRAALDLFAGVDDSTYRSLVSEERTLSDALESLRSSERDRLRELDLLNFQIDELDAAEIAGVDEDDLLAVEEQTLAGAVDLRQAAEAALVGISADGGAYDVLTAAGALLVDGAPFQDVSARLSSVAAELGDVAAELRGLAERIEPDPERLAAVQERRAVLAALRRKYGDSLAEVLDVRAELGRRRATLIGEQDPASIEAELQRVAALLAEEAERVGEARRGAAPRLAAEVQQRLAALALPDAQLSIQVGDGVGDQVRFLLAANRGIAPLALSKVASGGELSRVMLALRLVLSGGPPTLVFDEVDAGIGGSTATEVGRALAAIADTHQVLVVTHLAQVAAYADEQVVVTKSAGADVALTEVSPVRGDEREGELARMLSGQPDSPVAHAHARELLASAQAERPDA